MKPIYAIAAAIAATSIVAFAAGSLAPLPAGWIVAGQSPQLYQAGIDHSQTVSGKGAKYIGSIASESKSWGTLMQMFSAEKYLGKRVRLQARVKTKEISSWAGLWMRVDGKDGKPIGFYNSQDKPIKGSTDWALRSVVLDVPADANNIAFGVIANGSGGVWIDEVKLEPVDKNVAVDTLAIPKLRSAPVL